MRLATFVTALAALGLVSINLDARADIPSKPGYYSGVALPGYPADVNDSDKSSNSFELYLPKGYGEAKDVRHPLVMVLGMGVKANREWIEQHHLCEWAEELNPPAIVVGVNRMLNVGLGARLAPNNKVPEITVDDGMLDYWNLADKIPHAHPTMRFLISWPSGGTYDSERVTALALNYPDKLAGYVLGPHPYYPLGSFKDNSRAFTLDKDVSVAVLHVTHEAYARGRPEEPYVLNEADSFDPMLWERAYLGNLRRSGNPFALIESVDWRLRDFSIQEAFTYLVQSGWQIKTGVTATEREAGKQALLKAAVRIATIEDVMERERRYRSILAVPGVAEWPETKETLDTWRDLVPQAADCRTEPLFRAFFLEAMLEHSLIKNSPATVNRLAEKLKVLQASEAYQRELAARNAVRAAAVGFTIEQQAGRDIAGLEKTISAFQAALEIGEGTLPGKEAKAWLGFLTKRREALKRQDRK